MYNTSLVQRSPIEDEERVRRDSLAGTNNQPLPSYSARSPTQTHFHSYSPTNGTHPQANYGIYSSRPSSSGAMAVTPSINQSPRLGPPPSPKLNGHSHMDRPAYTPRESNSSTYYDPTSEYREGQLGWSQSQHATRSPIQVRIIVCA